MNLNYFTIINHQISFNDPYYANLENLLNNDFRTVEVVERFLNILLYLHNNWNNVTIRNEYIENKMGGYWDGQTLSEFKVSGNWFTFIGSQVILILIPNFSIYKIRC